MVSKINKLFPDLGARGISNRAFAAVSTAYRGLHLHEGKAIRVKRYHLTMIS
jgi:hypothetical protein